MSNLGLVTVRRLSRFWTNGILPIKNSLQSHMDSSSIHVTSEQVEKISKSATLVEVTIPNGRMRGDIDGDGKLTQADVDLLSAYVFDPSTTPLDDIQLLCADVRGDSNINGTDTLWLRQCVANTRKPGSCGAEITGNWTNNPNYDTEEGQFYTDISITGMTANHSASVFVKGTFDSGFFTKAECLEGKLRIYAKLCPITEVKAIVSWGEGDGTSVITTEGIDVSLSTLGAIPKPTVATLTLSASSWSSSAKTYSLESAYPNANYDIEIDFDYDNGTTEQYEAYCGAQLGGSASSNVLKAMGEVPTIDIPVVVYATAKN